MFLAFEQIPSESSSNPLSKKPARKKKYSVAFEADIHQPTFHQENGVCVCVCFADDSFIGSFRYLLPKLSRIRNHNFLCAFFGFVGIFIGCLIDRYFYGFWAVPLLGNFHFNVIEGKCRQSHLTRNVFISLQVINFLECLS